MSAAANKAFDILLPEQMGLLLFSGKPAQAPAALALGSLQWASRSPSSQFLGSLRGSVYSGVVVPSGVSLHSLPLGVADCPSRTQVGSPPCPALTSLPTANKHMGARWPQGPPVTLESH